jgi:hypothetical protein
VVKHRRLHHLLVIHVPEGRTAHIMANRIPSLPPLDITQHREAQVKLQVCLDTTAQVDQMKQKLALLEPTQTRVHLLVVQAALGTHTREVMLQLTAKTASKDINLGLDTHNAISHLLASQPPTPVGSLPDCLQGYLQGSLLCSQRGNQQGSPQDNLVVNQLASLLVCLRGSQQDNLQGSLQVNRLDSQRGNQQNSLQDNQQGNQQ